MTAEERVRPSSDADDVHHIRRDASRSTKEEKISVPYHEALTMQTEDFHMVVRSARTRWYVYCGHREERTEKTPCHNSAVITLFYSCGCSCCSQTRARKTLLLYCCLLSYCTVKGWLPELKEPEMFSIFIINYL